MDTLTLKQLHESYETVPYLSQPFTYTHPDHLAVIGRLFGMAPAPVDDCRVLELGCGTGVNLTPMAYHLPRSRFTGIDQSQRQVEMANKYIHELDIGNIRFHCENILNLNNAVGRFDYIICHGVFSWVPESVRAKILSIISASLAPEGIALVSYNTYPGWHMREMIRKMMLYHTRGVEDPERRIREGKGIIDFLASAVSDTTDPYSMLLKNELEILRESMDWYLIHEYMEVINRPFYFHEFMEIAHQHHLQFLGEAEFGTMLNSTLPSEIGGQVEQMSHDIIQNEQYLDFIRKRQFRQTLLCRSDLNLNRKLDAALLKTFRVAGKTIPDRTPVDLSPGVTHTFRTTQQASAQTNDPMTKAAFLVLNDIAPNPIRFDALVTAAQEKIRQLSPDSEPDTSLSEKNLAFKLLQCFTGKIVDLHAWAGNSMRKIEKMPKISRLTIHQVQNEHVTVNQWHQIIRLDAFSKKMIPLLDGTRDIETIKQAMFDQMAQNAFSVKRDGQTITDPAEALRFIGDSVEKVVGELADAGLMI